MMYDPLQTYPNVGAFSGVTSPFNLPYTTGVNPYAATPGMYSNPLTGGISPLAQQGYIPTHGGMIPQQWPHSAIPQGYGISPWTTGQQNPFLTAVIQNALLAAVTQNPLLAAAIQNPLLAPGQQNPLTNPLLTQHGFHPQANQFGSPFGYPLAPQSWVGQAGPFGAGQQGFHPPGSFPFQGF